MMLYENTRGGDVLSNTFRLLETEPELLTLEIERVFDSGFGETKKAFACWLNREDCAKLADVLKLYAESGDVYIG